MTFENASKDYPITYLDSLKRFYFEPRTIPIVQHFNHMTDKSYGYRRLTGLGLHQMNILEEFIIRCNKERIKLEWDDQVKEMYFGHLFNVKEYWARSSHHKCSEALS